MTNNRHRTLSFLGALLLSCGVQATDTLVDLAAQGDTGAALVLLDDGIQPDQLAADKTTPLMYAAHLGDVELVKALLDAGADPNLRNDYGAFALSEAAINANTAVIALLLEHGADPDLGNLEGETALMVTARTGNVEASGLLLEAGADINRQELWGGQSALMWAAAQQQPEVVALLLGQGADPDLHGAVRLWDRRITSEPRPKDMNKGGFTALHYAARQGCSECVELLARAGADLDATDPDRVTALNLALLNFHFETAALLIDAGADPDKWDLYGRTPLHNAIDLNTMPSGGRPDLPPEDVVRGYDIAVKLLERGANPNLQLKMQAPLRNAVFDRGADKVFTAGTTPLLMAARIGDVSAVKLLLEHGALPDLPNKHGVTPLMATAGVSYTTSPTRGAFKTEQEGIEIIDLLIADGANIDAISGDPTLRPGGNPIPRTERDTRPHKANQGAEIVEGKTALHGAARVGWLQVAQHLIDKGIRLDVKDASGRTPMDYASGNYPPAYNDSQALPNEAMMTLLETACRASASCSYD